MTKAKAKDNSTDSGIVHIERGPWDIDPAAVTEVQELSPAEVLVLTPQASYRLTCEEAAPFMK